MKLDKYISAYFQTDICKVYIFDNVIFIFHLHNLHRVESVTFNLKGSVAL